MWLHVNNRCKRAVSCLYQEEGTPGIMLCNQTGGPKTGWPCKGEGLLTGILLGGHTLKFSLKAVRKVKCDVAALYSGFE